MPQFNVIMNFKWVLFLFVALNYQAFGQIKVLDKLEVLYDQGHYKMVLNRANRLLDQPDYDFSYKPTFYKSMALFQLADQGMWAMFHKNALQEARELMAVVMSSPDGMRVFNTHLNHVVQLKRDLMKRSLNYKSEGSTKKYDELSQVIMGIFEKVPDADDVVIPRPVIKDEAPKENSKSKSLREEVVAYAKTQLGAPYKWAGTSSAGFDCSGFTSFVMKKFNVELSRRAEEQYEQSTKIKESNAQKGDLVFFNNGSGISHVGILISEKGQPLTMIHSSSSKGIIVTNIEESEYWLKRVYSFGTYIKVD
jgi:hypothetical protein